MRDSFYGPSRVPRPPRSPEPRTGWRWLWGNPFPVPRDVFRQHRCREGISPARACRRRAVGGLRAVGTPGLQRGSFLSPHPEKSNLTSLFTKYQPLSGPLRVSLEMEGILSEENTNMPSI